jgi:Ku protein
MSTLQRPLTACRDKERTKLAMKSMWKGNMGFGMVNFPIKLYKGTDEKASGVSLCNTHRECGTAVKEPKYCPKCEKMLVQEDLQKAYPEDTKKTKCIPITEADLAALPLPSAHNIQIEGFVEGLTDRRYPDTVYFVEPEELGDRAFALFDMALRQKGVLGVAKVTTGSKEHLCLIGPTGDGLLYVQTIHWASELRDSAERRRAADGGHAHRYPTQEHRSGLVSKRVRCGAQEAGRRQEGRHRDHRGRAGARQGSRPDRATDGLPQGGPGSGGLDGKEYRSIIQG